MTPQLITPTPLSLVDNDRALASQLEGAGLNALSRHLAHQATILSATSEGYLESGVWGSGHRA